MNGELARRSPQRRAFTLVELLVVIAIIGVLVALLLPAVQQAREAARRMQCSNNLKQQGLAFHNYHSTYNCFPFGWNLTADFNVQGWTTQLLPQLEQMAMAEMWDSRVPAIREAAAFGFPQDAIDRNLEVIGTPLGVFMCPSAAEADTHEYSLDEPPVSWSGARGDYSATSGVRGDYSTLAYTGRPAAASRQGVLWQTGTDYRQTCPRMASITDGSSNTFLVGERLGGSNIYKLRRIDQAMTSLAGPANGGAWGGFLNGEHWINGALYDGSITGDGGPCAINCTNARSVGYFAFHPGGAQFLLADGSVRFISASIDGYTFAGLITLQGGEVPGSF